MEKVKELQKKTVRVQRASERTRDPSRKRGQKRKKKEKKARRGEQKKKWKEKRATPANAGPERECHGGAALTLSCYGFRAPRHPRPTRHRARRGEDMFLRISDNKGLRGVLSEASAGPACHMTGYEEESPKEKGRMQSEVKPEGNRGRILGTGTLLPRHSVFYFFIHICTQTKYTNTPPLSVSPSLSPFLTMFADVLLASFPRPAIRFSFLTVS